MMPSPSLTEGLIEGCRLQVLEFLPIGDVLAGYGSACRCCLLDSVVEVRRRRKAQFLTGRSLEDEDEKDVTVPPVLDRLRKLHGAVPVSYSRRGLIRKLVLDLEEEEREDGGEEEEEEEEGAWFLRRLERATRAHRIHRHLLERCTTEANPLITGGGTHNENNKDDVPLAEYVGDVLCAYSLVGNSLNGTVEGGAGGPTFNDWVGRIVCYRPELDKWQHWRRWRQGRFLHWYTVWVCLHSTLLRTLPLPREYHDRLGLHHDYHHPRSPLRPGSSTEEGEDPAAVVRPLSRFFRDDGTERDMLLEYLSLAMDLGEGTMVHESVLRRFGPLGPAFRGRDNVEVMTMDTARLCRWLAKCPSADNDDDAQHEHPGDHDPVLAWMLRLKRECTVSHPMTVMPPVMRFG